VSFYSPQTFGGFYRIPAAVSDPWLVRVGSVFVALFRRNTPEAAPPEPEPTEASESALSGRARKDRPTPSRREAEAARRQRVTRNMSPKEARREAAARNRAERLRSLNAREATPEKQLLRDYVDARFSLGEFLLPSLVVLLAASFLSQVWPPVTLLATLIMYVYIILVLVDGALMWRGFKKVLAQRLPKVSPKGLLMYGMNRCIQIRRFRMPPPRLKRGDSY
jgi:hypothetical protein